VQLEGVTYGNDLFVTVGREGTILTSNDGSNWTRRDSTTTNDLYSVGFANGLFLAGGNRGILLASTNGKVWTKQDLGTNGLYAGVLDIAYGGGVFVAVGVANTLVTSADGTTWLRRDSGIPQYVNFTDIVYGNRTFVVVGQFSTPSPILTSSDAVTWTFRACGTGNSLNGLAYGASRFVVVGDGGTILQSENLAIPALAVRSEGTNGFEVRMSGEVGRVYRIQSSTDLFTWDDWINFTNAQATTAFLDSANTASPRRFYRALSP